MPSSLSSLSACVSKTIVIATALAGAGRSDGAAVDGLDLHDIARVRSRDHLPTADVQADVVAPTGTPEDEVAGLHRVERHVREHRVLRARVVRHAHTRRAPRAHREAGAVEARGPGAGVAVGLAELSACAGDRRGRAPAVDGDV